MTRIILISDIRIHLESLDLALRDIDEIEVVGLAVTSEEVAHLVEQAHPHVAVLDLAMSGSLDIARTLSQVKATRCLIMGVRETEEEVVACARTGIAAVATRDQSIDNLVNCIRTTAAGTSEIIFSGRLTGQLFLKINEWLRGQPSSAIASLTPREQDILSLIEHGQSNKQIANALAIRTATVKNHVHNILSKLDVESRQDAADLYRSSRHYREEELLPAERNGSAAASERLAPLNRALRTPLSI